MFTGPNKIVAGDFEHWVEERGSKFMTAWDAQVQAAARMQRSRAGAAKGGLLQAHYGKGHVHVFRVRVLSAVAGGRAGGVSIIRESDQPGQGREVSPAREVAFRVLQKVQAGGYASDVLRRDAAGLTARDAGLAESIVLGACGIRASSII